MSSGKEKVMGILGVVFFFGFAKKLAKVLLAATKLPPSDDKMDYLMIWKRKTLSIEESEKLQAKIGTSIPAPKNGQQYETSELAEWVTKQLQQRGVVVEDVDSRFWEEKDAPAKAEGETSHIVFRLWAPLVLLCRVAEQLEMPMLNKKGGRSPFSTYAAAQGELMFRTEKPQRQSFTSLQRQKVVHEVLMTLKAVASGRSCLPLLQVDGLVDYFPLHDNSKKKRILDDLLREPGAQVTLDGIADYLGTEHAFYFSWMAFYIKWMSVPAVIGVLIWLTQDTKMNGYMIFYAFFFSVWGTLFLEFWKRRQSSLAYKWGVHDLHKKEQIQQPRSGYYGTIRNSKITELPETYYPSFHRRLKYLVSAPITLCFLALAALLMWVSFALEDWTIQATEENYFSSTWISSIACLSPSIFYCLTIPVFNVVYNKVALRLTTWENHRTESDHKQALIIKLVLFQFINCYLSLFYCAFIVMDIERLRSQVSTLMVVTQILGQVVEIVYPWVSSRMAIGAKSQSADGNVFTLQPHQRQAVLPEPGPLYDEYVEMTIQFGYVVMFGWCWPLAAVCAVLNNVVEVRSDGFKLLATSRRPKAMDQADIGLWYSVLVALTYSAVVTNCALIGVYGFYIYEGDLGVLTGMSAAGVITMLLCGEHLMIAFKLFISVLIPDVPGPVSTEIARDEYRRGLLLKAKEEERQRNMRQQQQQLTQEQTGATSHASPVTFAPASSPFSSAAHDVFTAFGPRREQREEADKVVSMVQAMQNASNHRRIRLQAPPQT